MRGKPGKCAPNGDVGIEGGVFCETKPEEFGDEVTTGAESFESGDPGAEGRFSGEDSGDPGISASKSTVKTGYKIEWK